MSNGVSGRHVGRERQVGAISSTTLQAPFPSGYSEANSRHDRTHTRAFWMYKLHDLCILKDHSRVYVKNAVGEGGRVNKGGDGRKQEHSQGESIWLDQNGGVVAVRSPLIWGIFGGKSDRICWLTGHGVWRKERYRIVILRHDDTIYWESEVKGRSTLEREERTRIMFWTKVAVRVKAQNVNKKALLQMGLSPLLVLAGRPWTNHLFSSNLLIM